MPRLIELMKERNYYLIKYFNLNEREMHLFRGGNFDSLDPFYETRQAILDIVEVLDEKVDEELMALKVEDVEGLQDDMADLLSEKDSIVEKVLDQDLQLISLIETEKGKILREVLDAKSNKKAVGAYKSGNVKRSFQQEA